MDDRASGFWPLPFAPLQALLDYWVEKRGARRCPDKTDIDPTEIGPRLAVPGRDHVELARLILPLSAVDGAARHMVMIMIDIGTSPLAARVAGGVEFGVDLDRLVPIPLPPEVSALSPPGFSWSLPRVG